MHGLLGQPVYTVGTALRIANYVLTTYLSIFCSVCVNGKAYMEKEAAHVLINVNGDEHIFEFDDVMQIDFLMQRFNN